MRLPNFIRQSLFRWALAHGNSAVDFVIGDSLDPYMLRWYVIPRNRVFNVYLHLILRSDDARALHDHPWPSVSALLSGELGEWRLAKGKAEFRQFREGQIVFRRASAAHRLVLPHPGKSALTLFITGPKVREWGFLCPRGWRHWRDFTAPGDSGRVDKGCD